MLVVIAAGAVIAVMGASLAVWVLAVVSWLGFVPTILKSWRFPSSEHVPSWSIYTLACFLNLVVAVATNSPLIGIPAGNLVCALALTSIVIFRYSRLSLRERLMRVHRTSGTVLANLESDTSVPALKRR